MKLSKKLKRYWKAWKATRLSDQEIWDQTLYPEVPQKLPAQIRKELFWLCRNPKRGSWSMDDTITHYFNMGIDRRGEDCKKYIFQAESVRMRTKKQPHTAITLADKWITALYLQSCGIATTCPILYKTPFVSIDEALNKIRQSGKKKFWAKPVNGIQGYGAFSFCIVDNKFKVGEQILSDTDLVARLRNCIVEPFIEQHDDLNILYPGAVASLRIVTVLNAGKIEIILRSLFLGASGINTSNLSQGGIRIPIDESGKLVEYGIRFNVNRGWYKAHPDTGVSFKGFKIPYWDEVLDLVIRSHKSFPKIHSVGWDVAISKNGPLIIEGNHNWGTVSFQFTNGPGREYLNKYLSN